MALTDDELIQRHIAANGVKRCPPATPLGIGPSRFAPNPFRDKSLGRASIHGGQLDGIAVDARSPGARSPTRR